MRKMTPVVAIVMLVGVGFLMQGCAIVMAPTIGTIYTDVKAPSAVGDQTVKAEKVGKASVTNILGILATGDASIDAAMKNGNITKIHHVDYQATSILGIIGTYTVYVYGE